MISRKVGPMAFAGVCLGMAAYHQWVHPLDAKFIGLVMLASAPWLIPWLAQFVSKVKVGDFELDIKEEIAQARQVAEAAAAAAMTGAGKPQAKTRHAKAGAHKSAGPVSYDVTMPKIGEAAGEEASAEPTSDPNKGQFGGKPSRDGLSLNAEVRPMAQSSDFFLIHAWVQAEAGQTPLREGSEVTFHLHPTFPEVVVKVKAAGGVAAIDRLAWGAFTLGAEVGGTKLELD